MLTRSLAVAVAAAALALAGCGGVSIPTSDGSVKVDKDGSDVTIEGEDGSKVVSGTTLPEDFPSDTVPLVDGTIINALDLSSGDERVFSVTIEVSGSIADVAADAEEKLESAGFAREGGQKMEGAVSSIFTGDEWQVLVGVTGNADPLTVSYTVGTATH